MLDKDRIKLEQKIAHAQGVDYACLTGNGTLSIILSLEEYGLINKKVAVPANSCFSVVQAILYSGNFPKFYDIDETNLSINYKLIKNADALIAIHPYGRLFPVEKIKKLCKAKNILFIEDNCVAQGSNSNGVPTGSFGDIGILSFGAGKIIDIGHGGAILTNDKNLYQSFSNRLNIMNDSFLKSKKFINRVSNFFTRVYNEKFLDDYKIDKKFFNLISSYKKYYKCQFNANYFDILNSELDFLDENVQYRAKNALKIQNLLDDIENITIFKHSSGEVYWRQNILIEHGRNLLLKHLLKNKYKISSWYPTIEPFFFPEQNFKKYPSSDFISKRILNIWVNKSADDHYISNITDQIKIFMDQYEPKNK